ncbi:MAG: stage V sporulation protein AA [Candidatus Cellulosilyticum pullistercoris]|uniref:Stage V sporulation protein AA n=1 Tax=Candidatus Cellulosilyticum pullistercoris TaxID=2838521 RepID=A0A9E2KBC2_9FIRM|nr:stage V sporulation protein AA [Candidatus Cellulosilyticum pullistercoris]
MDMQQVTIYLRAYKRKTVEAQKWVTIGEIADVAAPSEVKAKVDATKIFCVPEPDKKGKYIITIIEIINRIWKDYPKAEIQNLGEPDIVIEYQPNPTKPKDIWEWVKVLGVCMIVFTGACIAIMTYNTDTSLGKTFIILNQMFTGEAVEQPFLFTIPYSIGITVGIIVFFNHIGFRKITEDPTPMQVEMKNYEMDVENCEIATITDRRRGEP